jgi:hypothetical protein
MTILQSFIMWGAPIAIAMNLGCFVFLGGVFNGIYAFFLSAVYVYWLRDFMAEQEKWTAIKEKLSYARYHLSKKE